MSKAEEQANKLYPYVDDDAHSEDSYLSWNSVSECEREAFIKGAEFQKQLDAEIMGEELIHQLGSYNKYHAHGKMPLMSLNLIWYRVKEAILTGITTYEKKELQNSKN